MQNLDSQRQNVEEDIERYTETALPPLHRQWPQLGQELVVLEHTLTYAPGGQKQPLTDQKKREQRESIRHALIAQLYRDEDTYSRDTRYLAFLVVKKGRGGVIVGNPYAIGKKGRKQELPYTGLEGYYAGSEQTAQRPGMTAEDIIQEEAGIGAALLASIKQHAIEHDVWIEFTHLKHALAGGTPDEAELQEMRIYWSMVLSRLHVRVYHNPEYELTLTEKIEQAGQLLSSMQAGTAEGKHLRSALEEERNKLRQDYQRLSKAAQEQEQRERRRREGIRSDRLGEFHQFREATYEMVTASGKGRYAVGVQDTSFEGATITETIVLPDIPGRRTYPPTDVHLTPEQIEGYLLLAQMGEIGGDPLARSMLVSR